MNKYLLSLMVLLPLSTFVYAQDDADEEEVEEIVTTGIKSSLKDAIDIKRRNVGVVDAITAEDIGKFPDGNLAESLSRLVGVAIDRSNVEGSKVAVRGLGPEFNLVTLNGRQMPTVPGYWSGGRSFDFGDISSHGVSAVEVYKSANAVLPSGGLGATINMVTTKPLDIGKTVGTFSVKAMVDTENEIGDEVTPEVDFVFATVGEEFAGGQWGVSVSGTHQVRHNREEGTNEITWLPSTSENYLSSLATVTSANARADGAFFYPQNIVFKHKDNERVRQNLQTAFQYELGKVRATLDYTGSSVEFITTGVEHGTWFGGYDARNVTINERGVAVKSDDVGGTDGNEFFNNITFGDATNRNSSIGLNIDIQVTDDLNITLDKHSSTASVKGNFGGSGLDNSLTFSNSRWLAAANWCCNGGPYGADGARVGTKAFDFTNGDVPTLSYQTFDEATGVARELIASDMAPKEAILRYTEKMNDMNQTQLIGNWDNSNGLIMDSLKRVQFGYSEVSQTFRRSKAEEKLWQNKLNDGNPTNFGNVLADDSIFTKVNLTNYLGSGSNVYYFAIPLQDAINSMERDGFFQASYNQSEWWNVARAESWSCGTEDDLDSNIGLYSYDAGARTTTRGVLCAGDFDSNDIVNENIESIFVNMLFEHTTKKGQPINVEVGVRYEEVEQSSTGVTQVPVATIWCLNEEQSLGCNVFGMQLSPMQSFTDTGASDYLLPNINGSFEFAENQIIRFAASKTNSRPDLEEMRATMDISAYSPLYPTSISKGNPNLQPYESTNLDLAYEYYYAEGSYFAVNYFQKEIDGYHGSQTGNGSFNGVTDIAQSDFFQTLLAASEDYVNWNGTITGGANVMCATFSWSCGSSFDQRTNNFAWILAHDDGGEWWNYDWSYEGDQPTLAGGANTAFLSSSTDPLYQFALFQPINKYSGTLDGVEVAIQHLFEDTNWGVLANVTMVSGDTDVDPARIGEQFALPGFGDAANFSVFYEDDSLSARLSYNLRGETYAGTDQYNPLFIEERGQFDFSASYAIDDNASVFFEAQNLTGEGVRLYSRYEEMLFLYQDHGSIYRAGFRYKF